MPERPGEIPSIVDVNPGDVETSARSVIVSNTDDKAVPVSPIGVADVRVTNPVAEVSLRQRYQYEWHAFDRGDSMMQAIKSDRGDETDPEKLAAYLNQTQLEVVPYWNTFPGLERARGILLRKLVV